MPGKSRKFSIGIPPVRPCNFAVAGCALKSAKVTTDVPKTMALRRVDSFSPLFSLSTRALFLSLSAESAEFGRDRVICFRFLLLEENEELNGKMREEIAERVVDGVMV